MNAVCAYAEQTGATVLAEGIENAEHVTAARSMGASAGSGVALRSPRTLTAVPVGSRAAGTLGLKSRVLPDSPADPLSSDPEQTPSDVRSMLRTWISLTYALNA